MDDLVAVAHKLVAPGRGILAADESISTVGKRLASINVENTEADRAGLRHMLFTSAGKSRTGAVVGQQYSSAAAHGHWPPYAEAGSIMPSSALLYAARYKLRGYPSGELLLEE